MTTVPDLLVGVLALQGDVREHVRALASWQVRTREVRAVDDLVGLDGLVLPGGESTAIGHLLRLQGLLDPLRAALATGLPAYGSCAGLVLLADEVLDGLAGQALLGGLDVTVRRNAFGSQVHSFEAPVDVDGVGEVPGVFIRAPWVERTGPGVQVLARVAVPGEDGAGRVVAVRQGDVLATSFHPELTGDHRVHGLFVETVRAARQRRDGFPVTAEGTVRG